MESSQVLQWRKFEFFSVVEEADNGVLSSLLKPGNAVTAACSGRGLIFVGDSGGFVHSIARGLHSPVPSFPAHDAPVSWMWAADAASVLVTVAHPESGGSELKVWAPDRLQADQPVLLRLLRPDPRPPARSGATQAPASTVTAAAVHPNLNMLALGFSCGAIMLYRGDLGKDRDRGSTSRVIVTLTSSITNLHFHLTTHTYTAHTSGRGGSKGSSSVPSVDVQSTNLIITTAHNVYNMHCTHRDKETTSELDNVGCRPGCSALSSGRNEHHIFVIAMDDALYSYSNEGRAGCYAFPGTKEKLVCHRGYAVVVQTQTDKTTAATAAVSRRSLCNVYDLTNKVVALTCPLPGPLVGLVSEWAGLYAVCCPPVGATGPPPSLLHLKEKDLHTKMEILFRKNQYDIAVSLARAQNVSGEGVAEVLKQYGDWLYSKGELSLAVRQYIKTIPYLEPSYVIKKFLSSEHTGLLAEYLEALHAKGLHDAPHSCLLLNCYTRHPPSPRLLTFIQHHSDQVKAARQQQRPHSDDSVALRNWVNAGGCQFSPEEVAALVGVCREGGFYEEALQLSALHGLHSLHLDVLCHDTAQFSKAIQYLRTLDLQTAAAQVVTHGSALTRGAPDETLELLIELATDYTPDNTPLVGEAPLDGYLESRAPHSCPPETFEGVVCGDSLLAVRFIEGVSKRLQQLGLGRPAPRLLGMLLAEYLHQRTLASEDVVREAWEHKIRQLISEETQDPLDPSMACLLCDRHDFPEGKLLIWQHHGMYEDMLQHHVASGAEEAMLSVCEAHGEDGALWLAALRLLTAPQLQRAPKTSVLQRVLARVDELQLLPPMEVLELLSASGHVSLGQVRGYLTALADREEAAARQQRALIADLVADTQAVREHVQTIQTSGLVFTESKCDACHKELEFPSVHFFCKHSFHQHCFVSYCSSSEEECPVCLPRHNDIRDCLRLQASDRASIASFGHTKQDQQNPPSSDSGRGVSTTGPSDDVFQELAEYLARGLFTDYTANLAAHTSATHTNAARAAARLKASAAASALDTSHLTSGASESRLRMKEARGQPSPPTSSGVFEGRLRQSAPTGSSPHNRLTEAEGQVRRQEVSKRPAHTSSEARLRHDQGSRVLGSATEARVRSSVASSVSVPQSEARLRTQGKAFDGMASPKRASPMYGQSPQALVDQITVSGGNSVPVGDQGKRRPKKDASQNLESISGSVANARPAPSKTSELNPFETPTSNNPFGDDFETEEDENNPFSNDVEDTNPFKDDVKDDLNPFAGDDDYDSRLNPFGE